MKKTVKAKARQSLLDLALETTGTMESAVAFAEANGLSLSDDVADGDVLTCVGETEPSVVGRYEAEGICPATALTEDDLMLLHDGIGWMAVGADFVVD